MARCKVRGFTLLELLLALALSVLVMTLIVSLISMYSSNFTTRGEDIRRVALARAILNMIADDLRSTVTKQEYDTKVLQHMLVGQGGGSQGGSPGGSQGGGGQGGGGFGGGQNGGQGGNPNGQGGQNNNDRGGNNGGNNQGQGRQGSGQAGNNQNNQQSGAGAAGAGGGNNRNSNNSGNQRGGNQSGGMGGGGGNQNRGGGGGQMMGGGSVPGQSGQSNQANQNGQADQNGETSDAATTDATAMTALPLGIYGSNTNLTIDISRIPRMDEYTAMQNGVLNGTLNDIPGDIKSVSYYVQSPSTMGVSDVLNEVTSTQTGANGGVAGLVRRALDRAVMDNAEATGQSTQLNRTGELVAPEVLALEFSYYDGTQWTTTWDSSSQGLPWLVDISLAMQSKSGEKNGAIPPGISLTTMTYEDRVRYGIEVYTLMVTIPGAQLQSTGTADSTASGTDSGMSSVGL